jgi:HlyD family secretion protein
MDNIENKEAGIDRMAADTVAAAAESPEAGQNGAGFVFPGDQPKRRRRKGWIIALTVIAVLVAAVLLLPRLLVKRPVMTAGAVTPYTVARGDITVTLSGSGTLLPADSYSVTSLTAGDIMTAPFEEGDVVQKDQVLYTVDSSDADNSIQQAQIAVNNSQNQLNSALAQQDGLKLKAGGAGTLTQLNVKAGDTVTAGQTIAAIQDYSAMTLKILYQKDATASMYVGESAIVTLESTGEQYSGTVTEISTVDQVQKGNVIAREVTIQVSNPGAFSTSQTAYASIGGLTGLASASFTYNYSGTVTATASGTVAQVKAKVGSRVSAGQVLVVLHSDAVDLQIKNANNALQNAELSLNSQKDKITGYTIKSPIAGTIVEKSYKAGDKINMQNSQVLCTIYDLSYLTVTLNIDELDIGKVQPGQAVTVTSAAAPGKSYTGTVTKINIKGTTKNGMTSYPVTIRIDKTDGLLPGMNVDAKIVVSSLKDVLLVPTSAVSRNNIVFLKTGDPAAKPAGPGIPAGYSSQEVTLGPSDDKNIVITAGLKEGDVIAVMDNTPSSYDYSPFGPGPRNQSQDGGGEGEAAQGQGSVEVAVG